MNTNIDNTLDPNAQPGEAQLSILLCFPKHWRSEFIALLRTQDVDDTVALIRLEQELRDGIHPEMLAMYSQDESPIAQVVLDSYLDTNHMTTDDLPDDFNGQIFIPGAEFDRVDLSQYAPGETYDAGSASDQVSAAHQSAIKVMPAEWSAEFANMIYLKYGDVGTARAVELYDEMATMFPYALMAPGEKRDSMLRFDILKRLISEETSVLSGVEVTLMDELAGTQVAPPEAKIQGPNVTTLEDLGREVAGATVAPSRRPYDSSKAGHDVQPPKQYDVVGGQFGETLVERPASKPKVLRDRVSRLEEMVSRLEDVVFGGKPFPNATASYSAGPAWMTQHPASTVSETIHRDFMAGRITHGGYGPTHRGFGPRSGAGGYQPFNGHRQQELRTLHSDFCDLINILRDLINDGPRNGVAQPSVTDCQIRLTDLMCQMQERGVRHGHPYAPALTACAKKAQELILELTLTAAIAG